MPLSNLSDTDAAYLAGVIERLKRLNADVLLDLRALQADGRKHRTKVTGHRDFVNAVGTVRRIENRCYSDEFIAACDALYQRCKDLNARGIG